MPDDAQEERDPGEIRESGDAILTFLDAASHMGDAWGFPCCGEPGGKEAAPQQGNVIPKSCRVVEEAGPLKNHFFGYAIWMGISQFAERRITAAGRCHAR